MSTPLIAIVGRPNVGKSTFFNRVLSQRQAIVDAIEGITRDRIYGEAEWCGHRLRFIDTGGFRIFFNFSNLACRLLFLKPILRVNQE